MPAVSVETARDARRIFRPAKSYTFRCFVYVKSGLYVAECIDLDLMVKAKSAERALRGLEDVMRGYLKTAFLGGDLTGLIPRKSPFSNRLLYHLTCLRAALFGQARNSFRLWDASSDQLFSCVS